ADQRSSMSYVTGSHNFKVGMFMMEGRNRVSTWNGTDAQVSYRVNQGIPNQITQYSSPILTNQWLNPELASMRRISGGSVACRSVSVCGSSITVRTSRKTTRR